MRQRPISAVVVWVTSSFLAALAHGAGFTPDPASVQRDGPAYRYPQAGWTVLHVEGGPHDRGMQQGKLMWREIQEYIKCFANQQSGKSPAEGWKLMRTLTDALFVRRFDPELLEEMKGIADGAAEAGAKFDGRAVDLADIVAINAWPEIMMLDRSLHATPTGLEGKDFDNDAGRARAAPDAGRCSAFAATGEATKDGKAIIGHITMFGLYPCNFFNVWIDVKPSKGHRLVIQGGPGSVQSGMDWYLNDAGIVLTETTIKQTRFEPGGMSTGSRSRMAMQYGDSIDSVVQFLGTQGNGLYANEWLLADMKTNEIAMYELGTRASRLFRSSKNEWFGGTKGFYWGCNNTKDLAVRLETIAATNDRPADMTFCPTDRDMEWVRLYQANKGSIAGDFGKIALGKPPLVERNSCDAKYTTADMTLHLKSFAHWGDPYGQLWEPSHELRETSPDVKPIVPSDWTVLTTEAPELPCCDAATATAVDLQSGSSDKDSPDRIEIDHKQMLLPPPVWHGTILPAGDGDVWLASAFARFHDNVVRERELLRKHEKAREDDKAGNAEDKPKSKKDPMDLTPAERDELALGLFEARSSALTDALAARSIPLRKLTFDASDDGSFRSAHGRGVMLLAELRRRMGAARFDAAMDAFGRAHAGLAVGSDAFVNAMSSTDGVGPGLKDFFARWLDSADALPTLELKTVSTEHKDAAYIVTGEILSHGGCTPASIDVTVESEAGETTKTFPFDSALARFRISGDEKPTRVVVNKYGQTPCTNGWNWSCSAFQRDLEHTLIIYGTRVDAVANRIAAGKLQQAIVDQLWHAVVPVKSDTEVSDDDLRSHHLLLVGHPECSALTARLAESLPVTFGPHSFIARGQTYANADSAVIAASANPLNERYSMVCIAGLSPGATLRAAQALARSAPAPLKVMAANQKAMDVVPAAVGLVRELK